jgi:hypothetical protein
MFLVLKGLFDVAWVGASQNNFEAPGLVRYTREQPRRTALLPRLQQPQLLTRSHHNSI